MTDYSRTAKGGLFDRRMYDSVMLRAIWPYDVQARWVKKRKGWALQQRCRNMLTTKRWSAWATQ